MFKWFKKHCKKLIIASSILTACICGLFGFTKSYAYDYQDNTLVGNNLVDNCNVNYCFVSGDSFNLNTPQTPSENLIVSHENNANFIDIEFTNTNVVNGVGYLCIYMPMSQLYANHNANSYYNIGLLIESENFTKTTYYLSGMNTFLVSTNSYGNSFNFINNTSSFNLNYLVGSNSFICNFAITNTNFYSSSDSNLCFLINIRNSNQQNDFNLGHLKFKAYIFEGNYNINYAYSNTSIFVPYSSIEELQEAYNTLQQQYNDYVASHSYSNTQYNDLVSANSSLQQQLSTLQLQYDTYVASHSHTNEEYNELRQHLSSLQENYYDLRDDLLELQNDYEDLQNAYNTMKTNYDTLNSSINYGIFAYIEGYNYGDILYGGVEFYGSYDNTSYRILPPHYNSNLPGNSAYMWTFDELIEEGLLENGGILRIDKITDRSDYNSNVNYNCHIAFNHMPITSFYLDVQGMNGAYIQVKDYNSQPRTVSFTTNSNDHTFTYQNIYSVDSQFGNEISDIYITPQFTSSSILGQAIGATASIQSYNNGYNDGVNFMSYYKNEYDIISREYDSARRDIATLRELNESLNEQLSSGLGWKSLFFAMADTPLKTVSNVLGFELFGLNLFTTFIGMITVLGIVFLLKKLI